VTRQLCQLGCRNRARSSFIEIRSSFLADISIAIFESNPKGNYFAYGRAACFQYISCADDDGYYTIKRERELYMEKIEVVAIFTWKTVRHGEHIASTAKFRCTFRRRCNVASFSLICGFHVASESPTFQGHARKRDEHFIHHRKGSVIS